MPTILSRSNWTTTAARGTAVTWSRIRGIVCHYPAMGKAVGVLTKTQEIARLRGWRNYHVGVLGWVDIGYNFAIGQSGRIYSLRGERVGAHTVGHNSKTLGVLFIVGDNEKLTPAARASFRALRATLRKKGAGSGIWGHTEMSGNSTRCPGPFIMSDIRTGLLRTGSADASASDPAPKPDPARPWVTSARVNALSPADVKGLQVRLVDAGYSVGSYGIDGSYGDATGRAVKQFQQDLGLTADGIYGPDTEDTMAKIDDVIKQLGTIKTDIGKVPARVLDEPIALQGSDKGKRSSLRTRTAWTNHEQQRAITAIAGLNARVSGLEKALEGALAGGNVDLEAVKAAAAEGARQGGVSVTAEDVARVLDVTVSEGS